MGGATLPQMQHYKFQIMGTMNPHTFITEKFRLMAALTKAESESEKQQLRSEYRELAEAYKQWHLKEYGWAYGQY